MSRVPDSLACARPPATFEINLRKKRIATRELVADLRKVARAGNGSAMTAAVYMARGEFSLATILCRFGSWNAALSAAGLPVNTVYNAPDSALLENLADVWRKLGRQPVGREVVKSGGLSKFSVSTYVVRFGSWHKTLQAFARFINGGDGRDRAAVRRGRRARPGRRGRSSATINWRLRATVLIRDNCLCRMCGASPAKDPAVTLHVDHIVPWSKGGETREDNLQTLCSVCNIGKSDRTPVRIF